MTSDRIAKEDYVGTAVAALSSTYQPLDSDLTAIAALTTTSFGRGLLALADAAALRSSAGLGTSATANTGTGSSNVPLGGVITGAGPTGDASHTLTLTYNAAGQLTAVTNNAIAIAESAVTNLTTDLAAKAATASPTFTGTVVLPSSQIVTSAVLNTGVSGTAVDTDSTFAANSDTKLASQKAVNTAVTAKANAVSLGRTKHAGTTDYSVPGVVVTATSTLALVANVDVYAFILLPTSVTVDQLACNVVTSQSGAANLRMGIYAADTDWQPSGAVLIDSGSISVANAFTGAKTFATGGVVLPAGRYLTVVNCDVAITGLRTFRGFPAIGAIDSSLAGPCCSGATIARTYAAFPNPGSAWTTSTQVGEHPVVLRISVP